MADEASAAPLILVVTGAHLRSEVGDRPIAYRLRERMVAWLEQRFGEKPVGAEGPTPEDTKSEPGERRPEVVVCSDLWYLNDSDLRRRPTVSVGGPGVNALSAYLADKLPGVLVVDEVLMVQMDPKLEELTVCLWGINNAATVSAADAFAERYLEAFMSAAVRAGAAG